MEIVYLSIVRLYELPPQLSGQTGPERAGQIHEKIEANVQEQELPAKAVETKLKVHKFLVYTCTLARTCTYTHSH